MVKMVSLSDEAYYKLKKIKNNDSFSGVILKLIENSGKESTVDLVSGWKRDEELAAGVERVYAKRNEAKLKKVEL